jgi:hypothetical protein
MRGGGSIDGGWHAVAIDVDVDVRVGVAAQAVDGLVERHVRRRLVVDADDVVLGLDADANRGRVGHGPLDRDAVLLVHLDDDAQAAELALGLRLHVLVRLDVEQHRVRVERVEHAVRGRHLDLDEAPLGLLVGDGLQVGLHELEDLHELRAQRPRRVDLLDREALLLAVDLDGHLLGIALGPTIDEDLGHVTLHEVERAHEHALGVEAVLVEVVLTHEEQRLREDRDLREVVLARVGARRGAQLSVAADAEPVAAVANGEDEGRAARDHEREDLTEPPHARLRGGRGRRRQSGIRGRTVDEIHERGQPIIASGARYCTIYAGELQTGILSPRMTARKVGVGASAGLTPDVEAT